MSSHSPVLVALPLLLAGCLHEGPPPTGVHLFHGQHLASPGFMRLGDETMVRFVDRIAAATATQAAVSDLWITSFDGTRQRKFVANWSDYWGEQGPFNAGDRYYMVDERLVPTKGGLARTATLLRLGPTLDEELRLDGVWAYQRITVPMSALYDQPQPGQTCPGFPSLQSDCPQLIFERPAIPGQSYPTLYLWDGANEIPIGGESGSLQIQTTGTGRIYFILDDQHTLVRLLRPQNTLELLRAGVSRFMLSGDEHYVALVVTDDGKTKNVVRDLTTGAEIPLARPNPTGWDGFGGGTFSYSQSAIATSLAERHTLNLATGEDTFYTLPSPLVDLTGALDRPGSDERLLLDSLKHGVFTGKGDFVARRTLAGPLLTPSFAPDGRYLIYVSPTAPTLYDTTVKGSLMFQDADQVDLPASMVSPPGLVVSAQNGASYFFTDGDAGKVLAFWAHLGRASSDLYFADYAGGGLPTDLRLIAKSILSVSISAHTLFGVLDMSQQDGVGNLVYRDIDKGVDTLYSTAVSEAAELGGSDLSTSYSAYIVRGRADSDRSGLWLTTLAPPAAPDGGAH